MKNYLAIDFGSTFTKVTAIDMLEKKIIGVSKSFTTITEDVNIGLNNALNLLYKDIGKIEFEKKFASSSAAGGLKMVTVGLVPDLTSKASKLAATNAGAKLIKTYSYELTNTDLEEIYEIDPDIVLLTGGIDGGNKDVIVHNAKKLSSIDKNFAIIVAGNKTVAETIKEIINKSKNHECVINENVMPEFNKLNITPTKNSIRELFIKNIIKAKGLDGIQKTLNSEIVPTPLAVFNAVNLLSTGYKDEVGLGELMLFDVGGATTDVYSMAEGLPSKEDIYLEGMIEPFAKRTVEGDIGMRYSLSSLVKEAGADVISKLAGVSKDYIDNIVLKYKNSPDIVPVLETTDKNIDDIFAQMALKISSKRHCGYLETAYAPMGEIKIQRGKDLTTVKYLIGTGGSVINSTNPKEVLSKAAYGLDDMMSLKPLSPSYMLDKKNILAAMGLISDMYPNIALNIMKNEITKI